MKLSLVFFGLGVAGLSLGCASHAKGFAEEDSGGPPGTDASVDQHVSGWDGDNMQFGDSSIDTGSMGGSTIVYAHTDDTLFTLDPMTNALTQVGTFSGTSGSSNDSTITDLAVDSSGDVYVNTESVVYKANIPASPGTVSLTKIASISLQSYQRFYALAFTPANSLDTSEILVGGDGNGELWSIDTSSGATRDLGNFGPNPQVSGDVLALSGDLVFYVDASNTPTGLATVRSCAKGTSTCRTSNDYLVAVDMTAMANAYKNNTPATTLLKGVYGGSTSNLGSGTMYGDLFGLGAWEGSVFAFARKNSANSTPLLLTINTTTGAGSIVSSAFAFTNGWSGAGVSTSTKITVPPPN